MKLRSSLTTPLFGVGSSASPQRTGCTNCVATSNIGHGLLVVAAVVAVVLVLVLAIVLVLLVLVVFVLVVLVVVIIVIVAL